MSRRSLLQGFEGVCGLLREVLEAFWGCWGVFGGFGGFSGFWGVFCKGYGVLWVVLKWVKKNGLEKELRGCWVVEGGWKEGRMTEEDGEKEE